MIPSRLGDYEVIFSYDFEFLQEMSRITHKAVVADRNVYGLYKEKLLGSFDQEEILLFDATEENKGFRDVDFLYDHLTRHQAKRNLTLVSCGGGITQDVTGFVASTIYRGIKWIFIPTTLLAQADSCIGSKTSLNYNRYKNLIGTFYPPSRVYINPGFLDTLRKEDIYSGLGEVVKLQLMKEDYPKDYDSIIRVEKEEWRDPVHILRLIQDSLKVKIGYIEDDEFDHGKRNLLNFGHCFGHALETTSDYRIPHGVAVVVGMIFANTVSEKRGRLREGTSKKINEEILKPCIPFTLEEEYFQQGPLFEAMRNDKKRSGNNLAMIIPAEDYRLMKVDDVTEKEFTRTLERVAADLL